MQHRHCYPTSFLHNLFMILLCTNFPPDMHFILFFFLIEDKTVWSSALHRRSNCSTETCDTWQNDTGKRRNSDFSMHVRCLFWEYFLGGFGGLFWTENNFGNRNVHHVLYVRLLGKKKIGRNDKKKKW